MRGYCILLLLVVTLLLPEAEGWRRRRRRWIRIRVGRIVRGVGRFVQKNKCWLKPIYHTLSGRDVSTASLDANKDGAIDHSEALAAFGKDLERAAGDLLSHADIDGDSRVTVDEFERSVRDLMLEDSDQLQDHKADDEHFSE